MKHLFKNNVKIKFVSLYLFIYLFCYTTIFVNGTQAVNMATSFFVKRSKSQTIYP